MQFMHFDDHNQPLTLNSVVEDDVPAVFLAVQMYWPLCLYPTFDIMRMDALVPIIVVVMLGSELIESPFRLQVIVMGKSP